jgi:hypothetical protein
VALREPLLRAARRAAEQLLEASAGHPQARAVVEVGVVQAERAVFLDIDQVIEDRSDVLRLPVRSQPHHLVLARVDLEAEIGRERGVGQPQRVREVDLPAHLERVAFPEAHGRGRPFPHPVHGQHRGFLEGRGEEGAGGVALVVLGEQEAVLPVVARGVDLKLLLQQSLLEQLLLEPHRHGHGERPEAAGGEGHVGLQQTLELEERLVVESHVVDVAQAHAGCLRQYSIAWRGKRALCFLRVKRSSWAAATIRPSSTSAAALS